MLIISIKENESIDKALKRFKKKFEKTVLNIKTKDNISEPSQLSEILGNDKSFLKAVSEEILIEAKNLIKLLSSTRASSFKNPFNNKALSQSLENPKVCSTNKKFF